MSFDPPALAPGEALAFTSAAAVAALAAGLPTLPVHAPVFAVGDTTAQAARRAGFLHVRSACGDGAALARLILATLSPEARVLHPVAATPAFDLAAALRSSGLNAKELPVYETVAASSLPATVGKAIAARRIAAVLIHSPAAGRALTALAPEGLGGASLLALSAACAQAAGRGEDRVVVAEAPNEAALFAALDDRLASREASGSHTPAPPTSRPLGKPPPHR